MENILWPTFGELKVTDTDPVHYVSERGTWIRQVFQDVEWLRPLYPFQWERQVDVFRFSSFAKEHQHIAWIAVGVYLLCVFGAKLFQAPSVQQKTGTQKDNLKPILMAWNLALALFSFIGSVRMIPQLAANLYIHGFQFTINEDGERNGGQGASGLWLMLFVYAKYAELFDTLFLILRRRHVTFLHWYHHATVLLYCWRLYGDRPAVGIWFAAMNYLVHSVMYFYYFLTAVGFRPKWGIVVTILQLMQMVAGMALCITVGYYKFYRPEVKTHVTEGTFYYGIVIYLSYFALFLSFFWKRYIQPYLAKTSQKKKKTE